MFPMYKVRELVDKATNLVMNYTETEAKVRAVTNDDPWGASNSALAEIAALTFSYEAYPEVMGMLWRRMLHENTFNWLRTMKSLNLLEYLIRHGSEQVISSVREHSYDIGLLQSYKFVDEDGRDRGNAIRTKATYLIGLIQDDDKLREERALAKKMRNRYTASNSAAHTTFASCHFSSFSPSSYDMSSNQYRDEVIDSDANQNNNHGASEHHQSVNIHQENAAPSMNRHSLPDPITSGNNSGVVAGKRTMVGKAGKPIKPIDLGSAVRDFAANAAAKASPSDSGHTTPKSCSVSKDGTPSHVVKPPVTDVNNLLFGDDLTTTADGDQWINSPTITGNDTGADDNQFADFQSAFSSINNNNSIIINNNNNETDFFASKEAAVVATDGFGSFDPFSLNEHCNEDGIVNTDLSITAEANKRSSNSTPSASAQKQNDDIFDKFLTPSSGGAKFDISLDKLTLDLSDGASRRPGSGVPMNQMMQGEKPSNPVHRPPTATNAPNPSSGPRLDSFDLLS